MLKENCGIFSEDEVDLKATFGAKSKYGRLQRKHQNKRPVWKLVGYIKLQKEAKEVYND